MSTDKATKQPPQPPAVGAPLDRGVRALDPERADFEAWLNPGRHEGNVSPWVEPGRYEKDTHQLAWLAWRAARPKRAAVGTIVNVAAALAQRKPLSAFCELEDATHIGHRQFGSTD